MIGSTWRPRVMPVLLSLLLAAACAAPAAAPAKPPAASAPPPAPTAASAPAPTAAPAVAAAPAAPAKPALTTAPVVDLKVAAVALAQWGPLFIAQERGYFKDVGLNVELIVGTNALEMFVPLTQGQVHVAACSSSVACYNFFARGADIKIVADLSSTGKLDRFRGGSALVVRKDLWDAGTIRTPRDLVGRSLYIVPALGTGQHGLALRYLQREGIDWTSVDWQTLSGYPDLLAAMQNRAVEAGVQAEPLVTAGVANGAYEIMAGDETMDPNAQILYLAYWTGIERLGPQVGERFMVAYLRGVRDYINAFGYGVDQDAIIEIMTRETVLKDPALYPRIKLSWNDPDGAVSRSAVEQYAGLYQQAGMLANPPDLSQAFDDKYSKFAVQYLGEYRAPR